MILHIAKFFGIFLLCSAASIIAGTVAAWLNQARQPGRLGLTLADVTEEVLARLIPEVADVARRHQIRIRHLTTCRKTFIGAAFKRWKTASSVVIEYEAGHFSQEEESFLIAHEISHIMRHDLVAIRFVSDCIVVAISALIAFELTPGGYFALPLTIAMPLF